MPVSRRDQLRIAVDVHLPQPQALFATLASYVSDQLAIRRDRAHQRVAVRRQFSDVDTFKRYAQLCLVARAQLVDSEDRKRQNDRSESDADPHATTNGFVNRRARLLYLVCINGAVATG